jgi:hypothetical protein
MPEAGVPMDLKEYGAGFNELLIHDECTEDNPDLPDTCIHELEHEETFAFGGEASVTYDVTIRVRGLWEPTTIQGGQSPDPELDTFRAGGTPDHADYSQWHIQVSNPAQTYYLNVYSAVSHSIFQEDYEVTIPIAGGANVSVRVVDGNNRQINNNYTGRMLSIDGVTAQPPDGQVMRLDLIDVQAP